MPALVISTPESMSRVRVIAVKDQSEQALKTLQRIGVLHVDQTKELRPVDRAALERERAEVGELSGFVEAILSHVPAKERVAPAEDVEVIYTRPFREIAGEVRSLYNKTGLLVERINRLTGEAGRLQALVRYLEPLSLLGELRLADLAFTGETLFARVFVLAGEAYAAVRDRLDASFLKHAVAGADNETVVYAIGRAREREAAESLVSDAGGRALEVPAGDRRLRAFLEEAGGSIRGLEAELRELREELDGKAREDLDRLVLLREALAAESERLAVLEKAAEARYVSLIEGWIPDSELARTISGVREGVPYAYVDAREPEPEEAPPSKLQNPQAMRPFEMIVKMLDIPRYKGWDPTPIVAYSFAIFFGIMLSDVVYGLGVMLVARFVLPRFTDDPHSEGLRLFQRLIYTCSSVAILFGLLNGSYMGDMYTLFGIEEMALSPAVARLMGDPLSFVVTAILIGLVHVNTAHLLALIKGIQERTIGVVLNRAGLFLLQFGLPGMLRSLLKAEVPFIPLGLYPYLNYLMVAGIGAIIVSNFLMNRGVGLFLWIFDITGIFGDVISYARLAGVGLASYFLGKSFNMIVVLFSGIFPGVAGAVIGTTAGVVLFVIGHSFNVLLGGMGCFVHSMRLCFVEFLTKFYDGGGREYSPFRIRKRAA